MERERDPRAENEDLDQTIDDRITGASDEEEFEDIDEGDEDEIEEEDEDLES